MLKKYIKASSVSNLTDARYFSAMQVDSLGFDLSKTGLEVLPLTAAKEIKDWIEGPEIIGELEILDISEAQQIIDFLALETIQVSMYTPIEYLNSLNVKSIIKEVIIEPSTTFESIQEHLGLYFNQVDYYLIDFEKNGISWGDLKQHIKFNAQHLQKIAATHQIILALDFTKSNIEEILKEIQPFGLSLKGGMEEKVGFKSFEELDDIFGYLEE